MSKTLLINLYGAPGAGKSTLAAKLFASMKESYMSVELVTEYAKDLFYDGLESNNYDQLSVFAEQHKRVNRLQGKVDFIITDSPLAMAALYTSHSGYPDSFNDFTIEMSKRFDSYNILVKRGHPYDPNGRFQTEEQSDELHRTLEAHLTEYGIKFECYDSHNSLSMLLFNKIKEKYVYIN